MKRLQIRHAWATLCMAFLLFGASPIHAQDFSISVTTDPMTGKPVYSVVPPDPALDLTRYNFLWVFEEGYHELGDSVYYDWQLHGAGETDSVVLYASKRYDGDDDPGERVGILSEASPLLAGQVSNKAHLTRDPRAGFESIYHLCLGLKYPVFMIVTLHPLLSVHDPSAGVSCTAQYSTMTTPSGNYLMQPKTHPDLSAGQVAFFAASASNPTQGVNRADLVLPFCTADLAKMGQRVSIKVEIYEVRDTSMARVISSTSNLGTVFAELPDLWDNNSPIYTNTLLKTVVSSWDPNAKSSSPDSLTTRGGEITYLIQYENLGDAPENKVYVFDTLPEWLIPSIYDVDWDNPTTLEIETGDGDPRTYAWVVKDIYPGETGHITFKARVRNDVPIGTIIRNRARIRFDDADQDTTTNFTHNRVVEVTPGVCELCPDKCKDCPTDCERCDNCDCPSWWRVALAIMILLILLLLILLIRALRRTASGGS